MPRKVDKGSKSVIQFQAWIPMEKKLYPHGKKMNKKHANKQGTYRFSKCYKRNKWDIIKRITWKEQDEE